MKNYREAKRAYIKDHQSKNLKAPQRRLGALDAIEAIIQSEVPELLLANDLFNKFDKSTFTDQYLKWKCKPLSSAEKSVIVGLFQFSQ